MTMIVNIKYISILLLLGLFNCSLGYGPKAENKSQINQRELFMEQESAIRSVELTGSVKKTETSLEIHYDLKNNSKDPVLAWDVLTGESGGQEIVKPELAYVCVVEPDTLRVVRAVLQLPFDRDVYMKEIPYAREVAPGKSVKGKIVLPLPVEEFNPYYGPTGPEQEKKVNLSRVVLMIGWTEIRPGMKITDVKIGDMQLKEIRGAWDRPIERVEEIKFSQDVQALLRTDVFDRQPPEGK